MVGTASATENVTGVTVGASSGVADDSSSKAFTYGLAVNTSLAVRSEADEGATVVAQLPADCSRFVAFRETPPGLFS